jgi:Protein of unknown function (DUF3339)
MKIDIRSPKVFTPAILFALSASGMLAFMKMSNTHVFGKALVINALIFTVLYYLIIRFATNVKSMTTADIVVPLLLFIVLVPGVVLTLPPGSKGIFMSGQSSTAAVGVHTLVYAVVYAFLRSSFPSQY